MCYNYIIKGNEKLPQKILKNLLKRKNEELKMNEENGNKGCTINFSKNTITLTNAFNKKAQIVNSPENKELRELFKEFPNCKIKIKSPANRQNYTDLTVPFMKKCIEKVYGKNALVQFENDIELFEGKRAYYGKAKKFLFANYPDCVELIKKADRKKKPEIINTTDPEYNIDMDEMPEYPAQTDIINNQKAS